MYLWSSLVYCYRALVRAVIVLQDAFAQICTDLALSKREDFYFGAKLVRGAYMDQVG